MNTKVIQWSLIRNDWVWVRTKIYFKSFESFVLKVLVGLVIWCQYHQKPFIWNHRCMITIMCVSRIFDLTKNSCQADSKFSAYIRGWPLSKLNDEYKWNISRIYGTTLWYLTPSSRIQMGGHKRLMCINEEWFSYL